MAVFSNADISTPVAWHPAGAKFRRVVTVPTTALDSGDEQVLLAYFESNPFGNESWLSQLSVTAEDLDSGTPGLVFDIGIGDVDGVIDTAIAADLDIGQAGGVYVLDIGPVDVSGKYLIMDVTTQAGTAASGDVTVFGEVTGDVLSRSGTVA